MTRSKMTVAKDGLRSALIHFVLLLVAVTTIIPFYWMIVTSFKTADDVLKIPPDFFPLRVTAESYVYIFQHAMILQGFANSILISVLVTAGTLVSCSMAAFAFAKLRFPGQNIWFTLFLGTMMIPGQVTLIPLYIVFNKIGWVGTYLPLIVPAVLLNAYGVFMIRQFMQSVPDSYVEAAKIDGCSYPRIFAKIVIPLCKPVLVTLGLFSFIGNWNNFLGQLIYISDQSRYTIPLIINSFRDTYSTNWGLLMAASTVSIVPTAIVYMLCQRFFVEGIALTGVKA